MTRSYAPTTQDAVADSILGLRVETAVYPVLTYHHQDQWEAFHVYGAIQMRQLYCEFITDNGGGATLFQFNYTFTTPAITVKALGAVTTTIAALVRGSRIVNLGGAVATTTGLTVATGGCSDLEVIPITLGGTGMIGTVGFVTTVADSVSGTAKIVMFYAAMSDGAYVEANAVPTAPPG